VHTARSTRRWLRDNNIRMFNGGEWPASSPDMNPIEHVWPLVSRQLVGDVFASRDQLWDALVVAFGKISRLQIPRLYDSMPRRLQALLDARGGPTRD
jgi:hypothetical protein